MRVLFYIMSSVFLIGLITLNSCGEDVQLPNQILQGEIDGTEWTFEVGKALSNQTDRTYTVELFNYTGFTENDGCLLFGGTSKHVTVVVPFATNNGAQLNAITANLIFHLDGINTLTADNGFVEISFINNREIRGFISSGSGSNNSVEGFFSVLICN